MTLFLAFLVLEGLALLGCAIYVRLPDGARRTDAAPVTIAPPPKAIAIPAMCRRRRWPAWKQ